MRSTGKRFSYFINSEAKFSGTDRAQYTYYMDWENLPQGKYHLHFTYLGQANTVNGTSIPYIQVDLGAYQNSYMVQSTGSTTQPILGILKYETSKGTITTLYADDTTNEVVYLNNKPASNQVTVTIWKNTVPPTLWKDDAGVPLAPAPYMLALHFELLEEA